MDSFSSVGVDFKKNTKYDVYIWYRTYGVWKYVFNKQ